MEETALSCETKSSFVQVLNCFIYKIMEVVGGSWLLKKTFSFGKMKPPNPISHPRILMKISLPVKSAGGDSRFLSDR